jgi:hypothetical protein
VVLGPAGASLRRRADPGGNHGGVRGVRGWRALASRVPTQINLNLFDHDYLPILQLKCYQQSIPKL